MDTEVLAGIGQWPQQPLSDRFLKKNQVKIGLEFEVAYDISEYVEDDEYDEDDDFSDDPGRWGADVADEFDDEDDENEARSSVDILDRVNEIDIQDSGDVAERGLDLNKFYRTLAMRFYRHLPGEDIISMAPSYSYYRKLPNKYKGWNFTYDSSITDGFPVELISPIMDAGDNIGGKLSALWQFFKETDAETNDSTGLHVTMSCAKGTQHFNFLVFALLSGDMDLLRSYGRLNNEYAENSTRELYATISNYDFESMEAQEQLDEILTHSFSEYIAEELPDSRYWSINTAKSGVIEYRGIGGDYLSNTGPERLTAIIRRLASAFAIACDPASLSNEGLRSWLKRKLYIGIRMAIKDTATYKQKFSPTKSLGNLVSVNMNGRFETEGLPQVNFEVNLSYDFGGWQIKNGDFRLHLLYDKGATVWKVSKLVVGVGATQSKDSTVRLARTLYTVFSVIKDGLPSRLKKDLYAEATRKGAYNKVSKQLAAKLDLQGMSVGQIVKDAILVEANKRMWRLAKVDPVAYKRSMTLKTLADLAKDVRNRALIVPSTHKSDSFAERLVANVRPDDISKTIADIAYFEWQKNDKGYDYIDAVTALVLGAPPKEVGPVLRISMGFAAGEIQYKSRRDDELGAANRALVWQREAEFLNDPRHREALVDMIRTILHKLSSIGCRYDAEIDSVLDDTIVYAWNNVTQMASSAFSSATDGTQLLLPGAITNDTAVHAVALL
jgi:hypothetical protein